eukprot:9593_1
MSTKQSISAANTKLSSYVGFCKAFSNVQSNTKTNHHNAYLTHEFTKQYLPSIGKKRLLKMIMVSLANKTPIAQFFTDIYSQYAFQHNSTINEFMDKSNFLSIFSHDNIVWKFIRRHLSEYLKHIYLPITNVNNENQHNDDNNCVDSTYNGFFTNKHNMSAILYYISTIHENLYILKKVCQIDVIFVPGTINWMNDKYFSDLGITYVRKLGYKQSMKHFMRSFNDKLSNNNYKRCVIIIMAKDFYHDEIYIIDPLQNNSLPPEIYNYTEIPWICNTKANVLPDVNLSDYDALCLSFHRHLYDNNVQSVERVYLSYSTSHDSHSTYCCRVLKLHLKNILRLFCNKNKTNGHPLIDWNEEITNKEFIDTEYNLFVNTFFADLNLMTPVLYNYSKDRLHFGDIDEHKWIQLWHKYWIMDSCSLQLTKQCYMYIPTPIEYYKYIDIKMDEYYKSMNKKYKHQFKKFILENELEQYPLVDHIPPFVTKNHCVLTDFDIYFPVNNKAVNREQHIFDFLQNCYYSLCFVSPYRFTHSNYNSVCK